MYTRGQGNDRTWERGRRSGTEFPPADRQYAHDTAPLLIPQDYHGEFLRSVQPSRPQNGESSEQTVQDGELSYAQAGADSVPLTEEADVGRQAEQIVSASAKAKSESLLGGLYSLFVGENSSEEETLLLLGIGLLLLWGHLDRGALFDRSTWDADDLALLMIGYLLLS